ncbi:MAG: hypothetical protein LBS73_01535 [Campylobacteraceae bacterium]|nr:hypothetical protein [Campylobacteraceae bacterium]
MRKVIGSAILSALILGFSGCSDTGKVAEESEIDRMVKEEFAKDAAKKNNKNANIAEIAEYDNLIKMTQEQITSAKEHIAKSTEQKNKQYWQQRIEAYSQQIQSYEQRKKELQ